MPGKKVAVITGASQGIGAALVAAYRKLGYAVVAMSRSIAPGADPDVLAVRGDVVDPATAERVAAAAIERFGRIDTLVNNAGVFIAKPFTEYTRDDYEAVTGVNLTGSFRITQLAVEQMLRQGGLQSATKALAIEYAARGIRSNAVALGVIKTSNPAAYEDSLARLHPLGRLGEISDVVDAIVYLENAPFVTGEILHVDGGKSAGH
ncbi:SDR family oxidoreductase [Amycolatopsis sp. NPDC051716]|uniref:SDR family NAD(P)-dependent oxidoreductase n=1 Tax=Amycolatopsis sp. NPDC051716 TaxID=3155804 RepID=UPI003436CA23